MVLGFKMIYKKIFKCNLEEDTKKLASEFAKISKKGDVFAMYGTLGVGKSTFSRFFIQSLCGYIDVPSPTFTLVQMYDTNDFELYHYDMYRLKNQEDAYELGIEDAFYSGVNLIEWPENIEGLLPKSCWKIYIETQDNARIFIVETTSLEKNERLEMINYD